MTLLIQITLITAIIYFTFNTIEVAYSLYLTYSENKESADFAKEIKEPCNCIICRLERQEEIANSNPPIIESLSQRDLKRIKTLRSIGYLIKTSEDGHTFFTRNGDDKPLPGSALAYSKAKWNILIEELTL